MTLSSKLIRISIIYLFVFSGRVQGQTSGALAYLSMEVACGGNRQYPQALDSQLKAPRFSEKAGTDAIGRDRRARKVLERTGDSSGVADKDNALAEARRLQGKLRASVGFAQEALKEKQIRCLQSGYELVKKQQEVVLLEKEDALKKDRGGRNRYVLLVFATSSVLLGIACIFLYRDMLQKRRLNLLLQEKNLEVITQNEQLKSLNAVKDKLFSIIGHDLRSPVATLKGFVSLLKVSALTPENITWCAGKIQESLSATAYLLDNLLFWARSQMEGMVVNRNTFDLLPLLNQNLKLAQPRAERKKVEVSLAAPPHTTALMVTADNNMVDLVVRNLLENAIKFSYERGTVTLGVLTDGNEVRVWVRDKGRGIPAADQGKIRSSIVSFTTMGTANERGSGLGLLLCRELVQKNGGRFGFESHEGKGSVFYFTLPAGGSEQSGH